MTRRQRSQNTPTRRDRRCAGRRSISALSTRRPLTGSSIRDACSGRNPKRPPRIDSRGLVPRNKGDERMMGRIIGGVLGSAIGRTKGRSEEHTSELQSLMRNSYAVFCLTKKNKPENTTLLPLYKHITSICHILP